MEENKSKVYILLDSNNRITRCEGGYTLSNIKDISKWTLIDEGEGDKYNLCQTHYFEDGIMTDDGIYRYKYENGTCVRRSEEETAADRAAVIPQPSQLDRIEAQVMYTALMTDSLIEEDA